MASFYQILRQEQGMTAQISLMVNAICREIKLSSNTNATTANIFKL
jgi:hypothetical protein